MMISEDQSMAKGNDFFVAGVHLLKAQTQVNERVMREKPPADPQLTTNMVADL